MNFLHILLNIVFPIKCVSCGKRGTDFCSQCLLSSPAAERESEGWIFPLYDYRHEPIKKSIWLLKYKNNKRLISIFAEAMYGRILEELSDLGTLENFKDPILIPIPLSQVRYRERGFNQAELIAQKILKLGGENFTLESNVLIKPKETLHQAHIENRGKRLKNMLGAFSIKNKERIKNRNIILIDDVTTTGATLVEARKVLKREGARAVIAFTLAH